MNMNLRGKTKKKEILSSSLKCNFICSRKVMSISLSLRLIPLTFPHSSSSAFNLKTPSPKYYLSFRSKTSLKPLNATAKFPPFIAPSKSLSLIKPHVQSHYKPIIAGWLCSVVSVFSLSKLIPKIACLSSNLTVDQLKSDGWVLGVFVLARLVATYWQQAFLWEAALSAVYDIRVNVFERVLQRELSFFEGGSGVSSGDIAYRITAEANDVADTIYALLNVSNCRSYLWNLLMCVLRNFIESDFLLKHFEQDINFGCTINCFFFIALMNFVL